MLICDYELVEEVLIDNPEIDPSKRMLFFKFQNVFNDGQSVSDNGSADGKPSVLIATSRVNIDNVLSIRSNTGTINIEVDANFLDEQLSNARLSPTLCGLLQNVQPLLFEQVVYTSLRNIINEILNPTINGNLNLYLLRIKTEELICKLLMEFEDRNEKQLYALNDHDILSVYKVRDQILKCLDIPPLIDNLSTLAGMSRTKLKRIFK